MPSVPVNGIDLYYETSGEETDPPLLLICGLGMQMVSWGDDWIDAIVAKGYFVIAFDNRDAGLSTHLVESGVPDLMALLQGGDANIAYYLSDMADDTAALLGALGLESVHVLGISMGGMIAQQLAISHPTRLRSLTSIMSTTGNPHVGQPSQTAAEALLSLNAQSRQEAIDSAIVVFGIIGSPGFPPDEDRLRRLAAVAYDRSNEPTGIARQMGAILASPDRTTGLGEVVVPTLVVHGASDPLVNPSGGEATAKAVPGARLVYIEGMGHDLPEQVWEQILSEVDENAQEGERRLAGRRDASAR
ncbi:MAG: alpha/beta fold hydrolase [Acidimicrobiales bacterium]|jgi:pimeloyl-ACP methyl ester carboxylesterase